MTLFAQYTYANTVVFFRLLKNWLDSVGKVIYIIKTILVLYFKLLLVIMWGISVGLFSTMSYNPALEPYSLGDLKLYIILLLGNICCIPWLVLWCKRLPLAFNKPKIYYKAKGWIQSKKEQALIYKVIINSLMILLALCFLMYIIIAIGSLLALTPYFIYAIFHYIFYFRTLFI